MRNQVRRVAFAVAVSTMALAPAAHAVEWKEVLTKTKDVVSGVLNCKEKLPEKAKELLEAAKVRVGKYLDDVPGLKSLEEALKKAGNSKVGEVLLGAANAAGTCVGHVLKGAICALPGKLSDVVDVGKAVVKGLSWVKGKSIALFNWVKDKIAGKVANEQESQTNLKETIFKLASKGYEKAGECWRGFKKFLIEKAKNPLETFKEAGKWLCEKGGEVLVDWALAAATSGVSASANIATKVADAVGLLGSLPNVKDILKDAGKAAAQTALEACLKEATK
jgi:hypothetical protein